MSFTRPFTTLRKLTFEIADCRVDYANNEGHLKFVIEPYTPVPSFTSTTSNPLLSAQPQSTSTLEDIPPSPSPSQPNTPRHSPSSPEIDPEEYLLPFQKEIETVTPIQLEEDSSTTDTKDSREDISKDSREENSSTRNTSKDSREENSSTDISNFDISDFVRSEKFQRRTKKVKTPLSEQMFSQIAESPQAMRECLLQILNRFPDILDENNGNEIIQYLDTNKGPIQINQPISEPKEIAQQQSQNYIVDHDNNTEVTNTLDNENPLEKDKSPDNKTEDKDNLGEKVESEKRHDNETQDNYTNIDTKEKQNENGDNEPMVPTSLSPEKVLVIEDSEDSDCQIQSISPPSAKKSLEHDNEITEITPEASTSDHSLQNEQAPPTDKAPPTGKSEPIASTSGHNTLGVSPTVEINRMPYLLHNIHFSDRSDKVEIIVKRFLSRKRPTTDTDSQNITKPEKHKKHRKDKRDKQQ